MTNIVCRTAYKLSLNNIDRNSKSNDKDINYVGKLTDYYSDEKKRALNMIDYFTGKINKNENYNLILEDGRYANKDEYDQRKKYIVRQFKKSNIWQMVLSFDKEFVDTNIEWRDLEVILAKKVLPKFFKKMGFEDAKNMRYEFSLHTNTKHPHFHISFMEKVPNTKDVDNKLIYRRTGVIPKKAINFLKNELVLSIEREKEFRPKSIEINKDIDELKKYFSPDSKNYILYDKSNILIEEKIIRLGKLLEERHNLNNARIKYNSIKDKDIKKLTNEIKDDLFKVNNSIKIAKSEFNSSIEKMNKYLIDIAKSNNMSLDDVDKSYTNNKEKYIDNYVLNAIVNHAKYNYQKEKSRIVDSNDIIQSIILNIYSKNKKINKKEIVKNSFDNNYRYKQEVRNSIRRINQEMEDAAEEFYRIFKSNDNEKEIEI